MRTLAFICVLVIGSVLKAQSNNGIDMECCKPGKWHTADPSGWRGVYIGKALLCSDKDKQFRFVEIRVPQVFTDLHKVKVTARIRRIEGEGERFRVYKLNVNPVDGKPETQVAIFAQTINGEQAEGDYFVRYKIKGR